VSSRSSRTALAICALPPAALAVWLLLVVTGPLQRAFWTIEPMTLPEAIALSDPATARWLVLQGADVDAPDRVRAGVLEAGAVRVTPLEAAVRSNGGEWIDLAFALGANPPSGNLQRAYCLAEGLPHQADAWRRLAAHTGVPPPDDCQ